MTRNRLGGNDASASSLTGESRKKTKTKKNRSKGFQRLELQKANDEDMMRQMRQMSSPTKLGAFFSSFSVPTEFASWSWLQVFRLADMTRSGDLNLEEPVRTASGGKCYSKNVWEKPWQNMTKQPKMVEKRQKPASCFFSRQKRVDEKQQTYFRNTGDFWEGKNCRNSFGAGARNLYPGMPRSLFRRTCV